MKVSDLEWIDELGPEWKHLSGLPAVFVLPNHHEKGRTLSLSKPYLDTEDIPHPIILDPSDSRCTYNLLKWWIKEALPPSHKGLLFLRIASKKVLTA